jgi:hypothetical protein
MHTPTPAAAQSAYPTVTEKRESDELMVAEKLEKELKDLRRRREEVPVRSRGCLIPVSRWGSRALDFS